MKAFPFRSRLAPRKGIGIRCATVATLSVLVLICAGCETLFQGRPRSNYVVTMHLLARNHESTRPFIMPVKPLGSDRTYWVYRVPVLSSRHIVRAVPVRNEDSVSAVEFETHPVHRLKWVSLAAEHGGQRVAVLVNGYFRFLWRVPETYSPESRTLTVEGPWDPREAELIAEWAPDNYEEFNRD